MAITSPFDKGINPTQFLQILFKIDDSEDYDAEYVEISQKCEYANLELDTYRNLYNRTAEVVNILSQKVRDMTKAELILGKQLDQSKVIYNTM